jgi:hypothetical protein
MHASATETSVENYFTRQYIPEVKSELQYERIILLVKAAKTGLAQICIGIFFFQCLIQFLKLFLFRTRRGPPVVHGPQFDKH